MITIVSYDGDVRTEWIPVPCACGGEILSKVSVDESICNGCGTTYDGRRAFQKLRLVTDDEAATAKQWREDELMRDLENARQRIAGAEVPT